MFSLSAEVRGHVICVALPRHTYFQAASLSWSYYGSSELDACAYLALCCMLWPMNQDAYPSSARYPMSISRTLAGVGCGAVLAAVATAAIGGPANLPTLALEIGLLTVLLLALGCLLQYRHSRTDRTPSDPPLVRRLQQHPELLVAYHSLADSLAAMANNSDEILRDDIIVKLATIQEEMRLLATGKPASPAPEQ